MRGQTATRCLAKGRLLSRTQSQPEGRLETEADFSGHRSGDEAKQDLNARTAGRSRFRRLLKKSRR